MKQWREPGKRYQKIFDICIVKSKPCGFFDKIYNPQGVKPDPKEVEAIKKMQRPSTKQELHSFLGMINYWSQFIPFMSELTFNLRKLQKKDVLFNGQIATRKNFRNWKAKSAVISCLQYFDTTKPVTLQVDASKVGLGAVLVQDSQGRSRPVAFASKKLTPAKTRYANIKCEILAVVFGCMRFHHYLHGGEFTCQSDQKPLKHIHLKHLCDAPASLQRLMLRIQPYNFVI